MISEDQRDVLVKNKPALMAKMEPDQVVSLLHAGYILRDREKERIMSRDTPSGRNDALISSILRKYKLAFLLFKQALERTGQAELVDLLTGACSAPLPGAGKPRDVKCDIDLRQEDPLLRPLVQEKAAKLLQYIILQKEFGY